MCPGEQDILCMEMQLDVLMQRSNPDWVGAKAFKNICKFPFPAFTSHSAYVATETESDGVKIDGLLPPNFL